MQIKISFLSERDIILPIHYNHIVQGFIYNNIDEELADFMHNQGYVNSGRTFKLFTFSNILNRGILKNKKFNFKNRIDIIISSPIEKFCKSIVNAMLLNDNLVLGQNIIKVEQIQILENEVPTDQIEVETLSPITIYSTLLKQDGKKFTYYYQDKERDFQKLIGENLIKKYNSFYGKDSIVDNDIQIISKGNTKQSIVYYKNFIVKGQVGKFTIKGNKKLLQMGLDAGFGGKNSQGFGCVRLIGKEEV